MVRTQQPAFLPSVSSRMAWACLRQLERAVPEVEPEDVALVGEEVVTDAQALHGGQVALDDARGHQLGQARGLVVAGLDGVEGLRLQLLARGVGGVEIADLRVEVPAVVVEARAAGERRHLVVGLAVHVPEAHDDVRDLDARVVDVVLHAPRHPRGTGARSRRCRPGWRCGGGRCGRPCSG
jgi:hypothetical protein